MAEVTFQDVGNLLASGDRSTIIIDVREPAELKNDGRIPGFQNIPLQQLKGALSTTAPEFRAKYGFDQPAKNIPLVFSCRSGRRATAAAEAAIEAGYTNVRVYKGSFQDWVANGGEVIKG
ncbi:rhodanese domain-containing protein CG4456-like isoform X2 [Ornithodoros turicata]|uniref:rhodanese domain-containing protein CG4456-like isoform X2 n=1 Tax=Ornithodoros turicata TaxID=34597 RepID=UPI0031388E77